MKNYPQDADASVQNKNKTGSEGDSAAAPFLQGVTLGQLQQAHVERQEEWCPDQKPDLSFRGNEMAGEVGEACNVIKKLERERQGWRGSRATKQQLADELADVVHTAILCAITAGIDLAPAVVEKFNSTSEKNGLSTTLSATEPSPRTQALEEGVWKNAIERAVIELEANWPHKTTPEMRDAIRALSSQPVADRHKTVDELAAYLCDEFDFDLNPVQGASWPEHENDEGKRDGGYVRLQPSDVQAYARENAKRILTFLSLPASPEVSG